MTDLDRALKDALVLGLENDATAEHILRIAAPFIDRAFQDQNNRIEKLEAALKFYAANKNYKQIWHEKRQMWVSDIASDQGKIARKTLEGKND